MPAPMRGGADAYFAFRWSEGQLQGWDLWSHGTEVDECHGDTCIFRSHVTCEADEAPQ